MEACRCAAMVANLPKAEVSLWGALVGPNVQGSSLSFLPISRILVCVCLLRAVLHAKGIAKIEKVMFQRLAT